MDLQHLVLGVDGGGSHTVALLAERRARGRVAGRGRSGPSNIQAIGPERAFEALDEAVRQAFTDAGLPRGPVAAAALGLAGVDGPGAAATIRTWAERVNLARVVAIDNDAPLLLAAGTPDGWGLAVIAGTGSIAFGRSPEGRFDRSGGWGYLLGDEGSAYGLALAGMRAVARASDGCGPATALTEHILEAMGLSEPLQMIHAVYSGTWDRARISTLAPVVLRDAEAGDVVARSIVENEARELARTATAAAAKVQLKAERVPLALTGGTLVNSAWYKEVYLAALRGCGLNPEPVTIVEEPAEGAVRLARQLLA